MVAIDPVDHELASFSNIFESLHDHLGHPIKTPSLEGPGEIHLRPDIGMTRDRATTPIRGQWKLPGSGQFGDTSRSSDGSSSQTAGAVRTTSLPEGWFPFGGIPLDAPHPTVVKLSQAESGSTSQPPVRKPGVFIASPLP